MSQRGRISDSQANANAPLTGKERAEARAERARQLAEQVSAFSAKQRKNAQRKNGVQYNAPTPERVAKNNAHDIGQNITATTVIPGQGPVPPVRSHAIQAPLDRYGDFWRPEMNNGRDLLEAARELRDIFLLAEEMGGSRITSSYDGTPGGVAGPRDGGVKDYIRKAKNMAEVIRAQFPSCIEEIELFISEVIVNTDGSSVKFQQHGYKYSPWRSPDAQKGTSYGMLFKTLQVLEFFLAKEKQQGWGWLTKVDDPEAAKALNVELRARAQIMREQLARKEAQDKERRLLKGGK